MPTQSHHYTSRCFHPWGRPMLSSCDRAPRDRYSRTCVLILDKYRGDGRRLIAERLQAFRSVIRQLEDIYNIRPFPHQTAQSLTELYLLVRALRPRTIFELGAGSRSSTVALAAASATLRKCRIYSLDICPTPFKGFADQYFPALKFGPVTDIQQNAVEFLIPGAWKFPLLMLYDAHDDDLPNSVISSHAITRWLPRLSGQVVAIHDCSVFPADYAGTFASSYTEAVHFSGRKVVGFAETAPLISWMNERRVDFCRPGDELQELGFDGHDSSLIYFRVP